MYLNLSGTAIADPLAAFPWMALGLITLDLSGVNITGTIPAGIASLTSLTSLSLRGCNIASVLPRVVPLSLQRLDASFNQISDDIGAGLLGLPNFSTLRYAARLVALAVWLLGRGRGHKLYSHLVLAHTLCLATPRRCVQ